MKILFFLNLLSLIAVAYTGAAALGDSVEATVGKGSLLPFENSAIPEEAKHDNIDVVLALSEDDEDLHDDGTEYFMQMLVPAIKKAFQNVRKNSTRG